jgi:hypothetical protein
MTTYFDAAGTDKLLLPPEFRLAADLANVAAVAERDVIGQYTDRAHYSWYTARVSDSEGGTPELVNASLGIYVFLRGYKADSALADVDLKAALKQEVVDVIVWRLRQHNADPLVASQSSGDGKSTTWRDNADRPFPNGFGRWLRLFDLREPVWGM